MAERSGPRSQEEFDAIFKEMTKDIHIDNKTVYTNMDLDELLDLKDDVQEQLIKRKEMSKTKTEKGAELKKQLMEIYEEIRIRRHE